ncbi:MAG TPA: RNA polymerase sigma factor region1.1 domain-containing protein [Microvirga sp.]
MIASDTLEQLIAHGRSRGHLTTEDLASALPVETMTPDEIALVVVHLEEAGVPVELDEELLAGPRHRPTLMAGAPDLYLKEPVPQPAAEPVALTPRAAEQSVPVRPETGRAYAHWAVFLAGIIVVTVLALVFVVGR